MSDCGGGAGLDGVGQRSDVEVSMGKTLAVRFACQKCAYRCKANLCVSDLILERMELLAFARSWPPTSLFFLLAVLLFLQLQLVPLV